MSALSEDDDYSNASSGSNSSSSYVTFNPEYLRHLIQVILNEQNNDHLHPHLTEKNCTKWMFPLGMIFSDWTLYVTTAIAVWIVVFGLTGNILSFLIMKRSSSTRNTVIYLCALAIADCCTIFFACVSAYLGLFLKYWNFMHNLNLDTFMKYYNTSPFCKIRIYLSFVTRTISVWIIAAFTIERFIVVYYPFVQRQIRKRHILGVIASIVVMAFSYNITVPILGFGEKINKMTKMKYCKSTKFFVKINFVDMCILSLIPSCIIVICNVLIIVRIKTRGKLETHTVHNNQVSEGQSRQERHEMRLTRRLVVVSTVFVMLTMPLFISNFHRNYVSLSCPIRKRIPPLSDIFAVNLMVYNLNFSINFLLYCLTGKQFRRAVIAVFRCKGLDSIESSFTDQNRRNLGTPMPYTNTTGISSRKTSASSAFQLNVNTPTAKLSLNANTPLGRDHEKLLNKYVQDVVESRRITLHAVPTKWSFSRKSRKEISKPVECSVDPEEMLFIDNSGEVELSNILDDKM